MSTYTFTIGDANLQAGTGTMVIDDSRYANHTVVGMQGAFDAGTLVLDNPDALAVPLQGVVYEVKPQPLQDRASLLPVGKYTIKHVQGSLPVFTKPVTIRITGRT